MATIVYLDPDDEITSAASRIRAARDSRIGLVLPFGSRVATSRINFRLLAREAQANGRRLDIVAPDGSARALAASAGLAVFSSVGEYESALDADDEVAPGPALAAGASAAGAAAAAGRVAGTAGAAAGAPSRPIDPSRDTIPTQRVRPPVPGPDSAPTRRDAGAGAGTTIATADDRAADRATRRRGIRTGPILLLVALLLLAGAGAVAAVAVLPTADITVTPRIEPIGPISFTVTADPAAKAVDPIAGVIPATTLDIPVNVSTDFKATGKRVEKTPATGAVRFSNCDPSAAYTLPRGTIVRTSAGTGFTIDEQVFLPVAGISGTPPRKVLLTCTTSEVTVTAVDGGPEANVGAGEIKVVPARYNRSLVSVTNPSATSGGARQEFPKVTRQDVDAAVAKLKADGLAQFQAGLADPATVPSGTKVFPETAVLGDVAVTPDPASLVDKEVDAFTLAGTATGRVQAVDASPIEAIAEQRLQASISSGDQLVAGSITVDVGPGAVVNGLVSFPVEGRAKQVRPLDAAELGRQVRGLAKADAERALAPYGDVRITLWPGWVSSIPTLDQRVTLTVATPVDETPASASPGPSVEPSPTASGSTSPSVHGSASPSGSPSVASPTDPGSPLAAPSDAAGSQPVPSG